MSTPPQIKILQCLAESSRPLTRAQIAKRIGINESRIGDYAGPRSMTSSGRASRDQSSAAMDSLGYVLVERHDIAGRDVFTYTITAKGKKCLVGK
jgi:DNA-binding IclR family transcriptional regulator